jgi:hypothetical protein
MRDRCPYDGDRLDGGSVHPTCGRVPTPQRDPWDAWLDPHGEQLEAELTDPLGLPGEAEADEVHPLTVSFE